MLLIKSVRVRDGGCKIVIGKEGEFGSNRESVGEGAGEGEREGERERERGRERERESEGEREKR